MEATHITKLEVGQTYENRNGEYIVEHQADRTKTAIRMADGRHMVVDTAMLVKIHNNITSERAASYNGTHPFVAKINGYWKMLGFFASHAKFDMFVRQDDERKFIDLYTKLTGNTPDPALYGSYVTDQWGLGSQIFFPTTDEIDFPADINVRTKSPTITTVTCNEFWKSLIAMGFRLGTNHNIDAIMEKVPAEHMAEFEAGMFA